MHTKYKILNFVNRFTIPKGVVITPSLFQRKNSMNDLVEHSFDYIRAATIKLAIGEIQERNIDGSIAELGVYKGRTSALMNSLCPEKKLYLMDTFEGFDDRDLKIEKERAFSTGKKEFADTSVESVMSLMTNPTNCEVVKGFFPECLEGRDIQDKFALAVIDVDLYQPILEGLRWFWPRMAQGGIILVHDYGTTKFAGAKQAVREFNQESGAPYLPLPDTAGSVAFVRNS